MNIQDLIAALNNTNKNVNITVNINNGATADLDDLVAEEVADIEDEVATDFCEGERVLVKHIRKTGEVIYTLGTVIETCGEDDKGYYTRVEGDNGKHYRTGLFYNVERLGSVILPLDHDLD